MKRMIHALSLAALALPAAAQDYEREGRWEKEVLSYLMVGEAVRIDSSRGPAFLGLYSEAGAGKPAVLLVHGLGVHPDHGIIGHLRVALADMGYTTLSIQMPVLPAQASAEGYPPLFPEAAARIGAAVAWLRAKGQRRIVLLSHSMGSWMSQSYFESTRVAPFAAWICMGRSGDVGTPAGLKVPVLDVYGENDSAAVLGHAAARRSSIERISGSRQIVVPGADHFYAGREKALASELSAFIDGLRSP